MATEYLADHSDQVETQIASRLNLHNTRTLYQVCGDQDPKVKDVSVPLK